MINQLLTQIICDKCNQEMSPASPGEFFCANGHGKVLLDLVPRAAREEVIRRTRTVEQLCPICGEAVTLIKQVRKKTKIKKTYSCGHTVDESLLKPTSRDSRWDDFFPFQQEGIEFIELSNYNAQLGDEMGLGKTIQGLGTLRYNYLKLSPCLIICEASKVFDWQEEFRIWVGDKYNEVRDEPIIHTRGKLPLVRGFRNHIISMSLLHKPKVLKSILEYGFKFMIVDESHSFKNVDTERTYALQTIAKRIPHRIFMSGTPIQNKVMEYFVPLNILRPDIFHSQDYLRSRCDISSSGRVLGLSSWARPKFFQSINDIVIRRTKNDAGIELPNLRMNKHKVAIDSQTDAATIKGYNAILDEMERLMNQKRSDVLQTTDMLGFMATLRHLTGLVKVKPVVQMVNDFLESADSDQKITIGVHHQSVMSALKSALADYHPLTISSESPEKKMEILNEFRKPTRRVLIASILGAGQGLNIQFCKNAILAERQWNPAKEDQFIGRFHRIEKDENGKFKIEFDEAKDSVNIDILNAAGFIDEYLDILVDMKSHVVSATEDEEFPYDRSFMIELCRLLIANRPQLPSE